MGKTIFEALGYGQRKKLKKLEMKDVTEGTLPVHWDFVALCFNDNWMGRTLKHWMVVLAQLLRTFHTPH